MISHCIHLSFQCSVKHDEHAEYGVETSATPAVNIDKSIGGRNCEGNAWRNITRIQSWNQRKKVMKLKMNAR